MKKHDNNVLSFYFFKHREECDDSKLLLPFSFQQHHVIKQKKKENKGRSLHVVTLTLGSRPRQGLAKVRPKSEARESHFMLSGIKENVRE
jgi:hypothetical protein